MVTRKKPRTSNNHKKKRASTQSVRARSDEDDEESQEDEADGVDLFKVEKIVHSRIDKRGVTLYRVRWVGYGPNDDTWEPIENVASTGHADRYVREQRAKTLSEHVPGVALIEYEDGERQLVDLTKEKFRALIAKSESDLDDDSDNGDAHINDFSLVKRGATIELLWPYVDIYFEAKIVSWTPVEESGGEAVVQKGSADDKGGKTSKHSRKNFKSKVKDSSVDNDNQVVENTLRSSGKEPKSDRDNEGERNEKPRDSKSDKTSRVIRLDHIDDYFEKLDEVDLAQKKQVKKSKTLKQTENYRASTSGNNKNDNPDEAKSHKKSKASKIVEKTETSDHSEKAIVTTETLNNSRADRLDEAHVNSKPKASRTTEGVVIFDDSDEGVTTKRTLKQSRTAASNNKHDDKMPGASMSTENPEAIVHSDVAKPQEEIRENKDKSRSKTREQRPEQISSASFIATKEESMGAAMNKSRNVSHKDTKDKATKKRYRDDIGNDYPQKDKEAQHLSTNQKKLKSINAESMTPHDLMEGSKAYQQSQHVLGKKSDFAQDPPAQEVTSSGQVSPKRPLRGSRVSLVERASNVSSSSQQSQSDSIQQPQNESSKKTSNVEDLQIPEDPPSNEVPSKSGFDQPIPKKPVRGSRVSVIEKATGVVKSVFERAVGVMNLSKKGSFEVSPVDEQPNDSMKPTLKTPSKLNPPIPEVRKPNRTLPLDDASNSEISVPRKRKREKSCAPLKSPAVGERETNPGKRLRTAHSESSFSLHSKSEKRKSEDTAKSDIDYGQVNDKKSKSPSKISSMASWNLPQKEYSLDTDEYLKNLESSDSASKVSDELDDTWDEQVECVGHGIPLFNEQDDEFDSEEEDSDDSESDGDNDMSPNSNCTQTPHCLNFEQLWMMKLEQTIEMMEHNGM